MGVVLLLAPHPHVKASFLCINLSLCLHIFPLLFLSLYPSVLSRRSLMKEGAVGEGSPAKFFIKGCLKDVPTDVPEMPNVRDVYRRFGGDYEELEEVLATIRRERWREPPPDEVEDPETEKRLWRVFKERQAERRKIK